ncbi:Tetratricopeptide-like helical domain [Trinorchestia longiramus]|nr:Tetratricopeptide-like helical domain [Trinorchestia longiramus]
MIGREKGVRDRVVNEKSQATAAAAASLPVRRSVATDKGIRGRRTRNLSCSAVAGVQAGGLSVTTLARSLFGAFLEGSSSTNQNLEVVAALVRMEASFLKNEDYLQQYRNISSKLRKRFLRKPNVAEASEEFGSLEHTLADSEVWTGAGLCCIAVARCQQSLANAYAEADALTQAARCYAKAEHATRDILCPSFGDNLLTSASCYRRAIAIHSSNEGQRQPSPQPGAGSSSGKSSGSTSPSGASESEQQGAGSNIVPAALSIELANTLEMCDRCSEALPVLLSAADMLHDCPVQLLRVLQQLHDCYILLGDLDGALKTCVKMLDVAWQQREQQTREFSSVPASFRDVISRCEVASLLLLLILQPLPQRTPDVLTNVFNKYSLSSVASQSNGQCPAHRSLISMINGQCLAHLIEINAPFGDRGLWCLLQSVAVAARARDCCAVTELAVPLTALLHHLPYHLHLLHLLVLHVNRG